MSDTDEYSVPPTGRYELDYRWEMLKVVMAVLVAAYYLSARWLHGQGMIGDAAMLFVSIVTLIAGVPLAFVAIGTIRSELAGGENR